MATYRVTWTIDLDAESIIGAAQRAREYQLDPNSLATCFRVRLHDKKQWFSVDLGREESGWKCKPLTMKQWQNEMGAK